MSFSGLQSFGQLSTRVQNQLWVLIGQSQHKGTLMHCHHTLTFFSEDRDKHCVKRWFKPSLQVEYIEGVPSKYRFCPTSPYLIGLQDIPKAFPSSRLGAERLLWARPRRCCSKHHDVSFNRAIKTRQHVLVLFSAGESVTFVTWNQIRTRTCHIIQKNFMAHLKSTGWNKAWPVRVPISWHALVEQDHELETLSRAPVAIATRVNRDAEHADL